LLFLIPAFFSSNLSTYQQHGIFASDGGKMKKLLFLVLIIAGCDQGVESDKMLGRIAIDDNVDGVRLGDDSIAVTQKLGNPNSVVLPATPSMIYMYTEGIHATMSVVIYYNKGVTQISVSPPYQGKTWDGIGIGSSRTYVISKLGDPAEDIPDYDLNIDRYVFGKSLLLIHYDSVFVRSLSMDAKN